MVVVLGRPRLLLGSGDQTGVPDRVSSDVTVAPTSSRVWTLTAACGAPPPSLFHQRVVQIRLLTGVSFKMKRTLPFKVIDSPLPRIVFPLPLGSQCRAERMDGRATRRAVQVRARAAGSLPGKLDGRRVQRPVPGRSSVRAGHRPSLDSETLCFAPCPQHGCGGVCRHASGEAGPHDVSQKP